MATLKSRTREEEGYFVSMTDMMVGLLFIFLVMLMYFALQYKDNARELLTADATRATILEQLKQSLKREGVEVEIDTETGVLRLPDDVLFNRGEAKPKEEGVAALTKLAHALDVSFQQVVHSARTEEIDVVTRQFLRRDAEWTSMRMPAARRTVEP